MSKATSYKITRQINKLAFDYVATIARGQEPALLAAWVEGNKYDIMDAINDARLNMGKTLVRVEYGAKAKIKELLAGEPALAARLVEFRKASEAREKEEALADHKEFTKTPFPRVSAA